MAKEMFPVFGGFGVFNNIINPNSYNILLSSTILKSFWKLQTSQNKINYINKKSILSSPSNPPTEELRNDTSLFPLPTIKYDAPGPRNIHQKNNYFRSNTTQAFSLPGTPIYLKYLLSTFQPSTFLPTVSMVKELKFIEPSIPPAADDKSEKQKSVILYIEEKKQEYKKIEEKAEEVEKPHQNPPQINNPIEEIGNPMPENAQNQEASLEIELNDDEDNLLEMVAAINNEQVENTIKELSPDDIQNIIQETKRQELEVLTNLKTFYTALKHELQNPPQAQNDSHQEKRELIVKNIDNILKDIAKSEKNIGLGISINRYTALITENSFDTKPKLDKINDQRQTRSNALKEIYGSQDKVILNYSEKELDKIEKFVIASGKDLKQIANTRNDDIRRKFFSSFIDHTISFAKYNINWAPAAYNLAWAVAEYIVMGIVVDIIKQGVESIGKGYKIGTQISDSIKNIPGQKDSKPTANLFVHCIATLSGFIGGTAAMTIMTPIIVTFTGTKDILYTPAGIYKNYQSYKKDKTGTTKNWAKSESQLKSERTTTKNTAHATKEQKKFAETVQKQSPVRPKTR